MEKRLYRSSSLLFTLEFFYCFESIRQIILKHPSSGVALVHEALILLEGSSFLWATNFLHSLTPSFFNNV